LLGPEHRRLARMAPRNAAGWYPALGRPDVFADREIEIMAFEPGAPAARRVPELRVARIQIQIDLAAQAPHERLSRQMPGDVQQKISVFGDVEYVGEIHARGARTIVTDEARRRAETSRLHHLAEIGDVRAFLERCGRAVGGGARSLGNLL